MSWTSLGRRICAICLMITVLAATLCAAQDATERVKFAKGKSSATISSSVVGSSTFGYLIGVRAGQQMSITYQTFNRFAGFSELRAPSGKTFKSSCRRSGGTMTCTWRGKVTENDDYIILIDNQSEENADFTLTVTVR